LPSEHQKTILLTGAMVPARMPHSDAQFNLGCALGALKHLDHGVFIVMNGKVFSPSTCVKNKNLGRFEQRIEKVKT
jgi:L-asparaginase